MVSSGDNLDDEFSELDEDACPFCGSQEGCAHLLALIDVTFGVIEGGTFYVLEPKAVEVMDRAIKRLLKASKTKQQLPAVVPGRLAVLVEEVRHQIGKSLEEEDLRTCYSSFIRYLSDLLGAMPGVVETSYDVDQGWPGSSSLCRAYWVKYAKRVAKAALRQLEGEAKLSKN
jgi:hypothetical protein